MRLLIHVLSSLNSSPLPTLTCVVYSRLGSSQILLAIHYKTDLTREQSNYEYLAKYLKRLPSPVAALQGPLNI